MQLPILPTDCIYKFMAVSGLVILIICIFVPLKQFDVLQIKFVNASSELLKLKTEKEAINNRIELLKADIPISANYQKKDSGKIFDKHIKSVNKEYFISTEELEKLEKEIFKKELELSIKKGKTIISETKLKNLDNQGKRWILILLIGGVSGLYLSAKGFQLWYRRVQKPQDELLITQAKMLNERIRKLQKKNKRNVNQSIRRNTQNK